MSLLRSSRDSDTSEDPDRVKVVGSDASTGATESVEECKAAPTPHRTIVIRDFPIADTILQLTTEKGEIIDFVVCRTPLILASPVLAKMLDPGSRLPSLKKLASNHGATREYLMIYDDQPQALLLFLRVTHMQFSKVPKDIDDLQRLVDLSYFCDKYDCVQAFDTWRESWLDAWCHRALQPMNEKWLQVAVVFGEPRNFSALTAKMIKNSGPLFLKDGVVVANESSNARWPTLWPHVPEPILLSIKKARDTAIVKLANVTKTFTNHNDLKFAPARNTQSHVIYKYRCTEVCMALAYGLLLRGVNRYPNIRALLDENYITSEAISLDLTVTEYYRQILMSIHALEAGWSCTEPRSGGNYCTVGELARDFRAQCGRIFEGIQGLDPSEFVRYEREYGNWEEMQ